MAKSVDFYYDYGSPAAYLAWTQMARICAERDATLNDRPFLLGAVFKATGNASPITIPAKARFMAHDLPRWARHWGVAFEFNPHFPINSMWLMRAATGVQLHQPERLDDFNRTIFKAMWVDRRNLSEPEVVADVITVAGFDAAAVAATPAKMRSRLRCAPPPTKPWPVAPSARPLSSWEMTCTGDRIGCSWWRRHSRPDCACPHRAHARVVRRPQHTRRRLSQAGYPHIPSFSNCCGAASAGTITPSSACPAAK